MPQPQPQLQPQPYPNHRLRAGFHKFRRRNEGSDLNKAEGNCQVIGWGDCCGNYPSEFFHQLKTLPVNRLSIRKLTTYWGFRTNRERTDLFRWLSIICYWIYLKNEIVKNHGPLQVSGNSLTGVMNLRNRLQINLKSDQLFTKTYH